MIKKVRNFISRVFGNKYIDLGKVNKAKESGLVPVFNSNKDGVISR